MSDHNAEWVATGGAERDSVPTRVLSYVTVSVDWLRLQAPYPGQTHTH